MPQNDDTKIISQNRRARFNYEIVEKNASLLIPLDANSNEDEVMEEGSKLIKHSGTIGKIPSKSQIKIDAESGFINIYKQ